MARELLLIALVAACSRDRPGASGQAAQPASGAPPLASKAFYRVDAGPEVACTAGATCEARLQLTALGDYHINQDYPFKFVGEPAPALPLVGEAAFALADAKHGTLTVRFTPTAAGARTLAGVFKLSVCSDDTCEIEKPKLALAVTVR
jgi:hypothetical protein